MDREQLVDLIVTTVKDLAAPNASEAPLEIIDDTTRLFGSHGLFDSLGLVSVILDVEQQVNDLLGTSITIAEERAMSQSRSPFRTVGSLADYVLMLIQEQQRG